MTSLQLGLIVAGVVLVIGVVIFNWIQERRVRRRIKETFHGADAPASAPREASSAKPARIEPTLAGSDVPTTPVETAPRRVAPTVSRDDEPYEAPLEIQARIATHLAADDLPEPQLREAPRAAALAPGAPASARAGPQPDSDIECIITLQPARPVVAGALAAGLHARLGRPIRWFGRRTAASPWQLLKSDTAGEFSEIQACLLLANRVGAASQPMLEAFASLVADVAKTLPATITEPDIAAEAARAEALDRICADLDVQIGLTLLKNGSATIPGTRLRGIAEAAGFKLAEGGRFDWVAEESGAVLYSLQNYRSEPFTAEALRMTSTPGAVFLLDVPRVAEPVRVYDQMRLSARRMAQTLDATLVDDNRRALDDAALNAIRDQVKSTTASLRGVYIEPGSPRALALFGA